MLSKLFQAFLCTKGKGSMQEEGGGEGRGGVGELQTVPKEKKASLLN